MATKKRTCRFPDCNRLVRALGLCGGHWQQQHKGNQLTPLRESHIGESAAERMDRFVDKSGDCWEWTGSTYENGYGQFHFEGRSMNAHRAAYIMAHGVIPDGMVVDHMCHNRSCVKVAHLQAATVKENNENKSPSSAQGASGVRGVSWDRFRSKWKAQLKHNGRIVSVGRFDSLADAERAVVAARCRIFTNNLVDRGLNIS